MFALILGSNFGANFTPIGALAGIMWSKILLDKGITIRFKDFLRYGLLVMPAVVALACLVLAVELAIWP
jgi:Na+/H+ antiporter NhaD/arsenite permease-like protein